MFLKKVCSIIIVLLNIDCFRYIVYNHLFFYYYRQLQLLKIALYFYKLKSDVLYEYIWSLGIESVSTEGKAAFQMNFLIICNIRGRLAVGVVSLSLSLGGVN